MWVSETKRVRQFHLCILNGYHSIWQKLSLSWGYAEIFIHGSRPDLFPRFHKVFLKWELPHCKDKIPKFRNKYSQKRNIGVSVPISTFMCLWLISIFPQSVCLFCWRKYVDRSWVYINRSQTHERGNWCWGRAIPKKEIHKWDFRCSAVPKANQ